MRFFECPPHPRPLPRWGEGFNLCSAVLGAALPLDDRATPMTQHRRKGAQGLVYSRTIREHVENSGIHDDDVCALGVPRCCGPANGPAEVVRGPHRVLVS